jgi:putative CocE/NonD family hydrolase
MWQWAPSALESPQAVRFTYGALPQILHKTNMWLRGHWRKMMERGKVYRIDLTEMVSAIKFPAGHRIRLDIASSNFPSYDRNLNTGGNNFDETTWVVAENSVYHDPQHESHLVLPVIAD